MSDLEACFYNAGVNYTASMRCAANAVAVSFIILVDTG
jgi:hypothetical protein